jgi:hypothetical protein
VKAQGRIADVSKASRFIPSSSDPHSASPCQPHRQSQDDDDHEDDQEPPASYRDVIVVVLVVDCFPRRRSEEDDEHENDQETPAPYPNRPIEEGINGTLYLLRKRAAA